jgi:SAM-dependent methyltransferase
MTRNVYDDPEFFAAYAGLQRSVEGLAGAPEWPALRSMVGDVAGKRVLDLGCGFGWFCRWAAHHGADPVVGIDRSARMLERARSQPHPAVTYQQADLDTVELDSGRYDLAYSSLAFHYVDDLERLIQQVHRALTPGGTMVASVEHPVFTAPTSPGFVTGADGTVTWPVNGYLSEGLRTTAWLAPGVVKHHRTIATTVTIVVDAGFRLTQLVEWGPSAEQVSSVPDLALEVERPLFLLLGAVKDRARHRAGE